MPRMAYVTKNTHLILQISFKNNLYFHTMNGKVKLNKSWMEHGFKIPKTH